MADEFGGTNRIIGWGLVKNGTTLATGTEDEMREYQKKLGGDVKQVAVTKAPTAAELLANDHKARTAAKELSGGKDKDLDRRLKESRSTVNIHRLMRDIPKYVRGGGND